MVAALARRLMDGAMSHSASDTMKQK